MKTGRTPRTRKFFGAGGTRRGKGSRAPEPEQARLFDEPEPIDAIDADEPPTIFGLGTLERDIHRMRLETSSNVYAQRRSVW